MNPPAGVMPRPMTYEDGNALNLEVYFRPLYASHITGDIML